jgi:hypothetical protein
MRLIMVRLITDQRLVRQIWFIQEHGPLLMDVETLAHVRKLLVSIMMQSLRYLTTVLQTPR